MPERRRRDHLFGGPSVRRTICSEDHLFGGPSVRRTICSEDHLSGGHLIMSDSISRRAFAERLALAAAAPFVTEGLGVRGSGLETARPSPEPQVPSPDPSALAKTLAEGIRLRYGDRLPADDPKAITQGIEARLQGGGAV